MLGMIFAVLRIAVRLCSFDHREWEQKERFQASVCFLERILSCQVRGFLASFLQSFEWWGFTGVKLRRRQFRNGFDITKGKIPLWNTRGPCTFVVLICRDGTLWLVWTNYTKICHFFYFYLPAWQRKISPPAKSAKLVQFRHWISNTSKGFCVNWEITFWKQGQQKVVRFFCKGQVFSRKL